ncbi:MAG: hypothetical protein PG977_001209 [Bartonella clarridgeiae]|nr:MAG: hypothetical protein PG977_001209 [Bartonella clarridgeiae]
MTSPFYIDIALILFLILSVLISPFPWHVLIFRHNKHSRMKQRNNTLFHFLYFFSRNSVSTPNIHQSAPCFCYKE